MYLGRELTHRHRGLVLCLVIGGGDVDAGIAKDGNVRPKLAPRRSQSGGVVVWNRRRALAREAGEKYRRGGLTLQRLGAVVAQVPDGAIDAGGGFFLLPLTNERAVRIGDRDLTPSSGTSFK